MRVAHTPPSHSQNEQDKTESGMEARTSNAETEWGRQRYEETKSDEVLAMTHIAVGGHKV